MTTLAVIFGAFVIVAAGACAWFMVRLGWTTRGAWRRGPMGRHTMALAGCLLFLLTLSHPLARGLPGRAIGLTAGMGALAAVLCWRVVLLEREQRAVRDRHREGSSR